MKAGCSTSGLRNDGIPSQPSGRKHPVRRHGGWGMQWADGSISTRTYGTKAGMFRVCRGKH
jgi:hypothetical protein